MNSLSHKVYNQINTHDDNNDHKSVLQVSTQLNAYTYGVSSIITQSTQTR